MERPAEVLRKSGSARVLMEQTRLYILDVIKRGRLG